MATSFNLGGLLGLGGNELDDLLSPEQRSAIQQRGLLSAAAALLQAGGPSTRRVSLGQALGSALEAGQTGAQAAQQSALTQMLTRQKLEEARQESEANRGFRSALESMRGGGAAAAMTSEQALAATGMPAGPTVERAGMIGQAAPAGMGAPGARVLTDAQIELFKTLPRKEAAAEILKLTQPPARSEKAKLLDEIGLPVTIENLRLLEKPEADPENLRMLRALGLPVSLESLRSLQKPGEDPEGVRTLRALNMPVTLENLRSLQKPEADPESVRMLRALNMPVTLENLRSLQKPEAEPEGVKTLRALNLPVTLENLRSLQKPGEEPEGVKTLRALNLPVTMENLRNLQKPETDPEGVRTLRALNLPVTMENLRNLQRPEADPESVKMLRALNLPVTLENLRSIQRPEAEPEGVRTLRALNLPVTMENLQAIQRPEATPSEIRILEATGTPVTLPNIMRLRQSGAASTTVNVAEGQKGFDNEMKLGAAFRGEPIYKDFNEMKTAYGQVLSSLNQGTPIGDVAGATKIMKLLDPGSVVRESELGIAMAAGGRMDRLRNYFDLWASGNKLTPTQRDDFKALSNELYAAAAQSYNAKRNEYKGFGNAYNFKNLDAALGAPATAPSVMRQQQPAGGASQTPGGAARPSLSDIFTRQR
jgi:hypothetical protein